MYDAATHAQALQAETDEFGASLARAKSPGSRALDATPWRVLVDVERAYASTGRGGLEAALPKPVPVAILGEAKWLWEDWGP